MNKYVYQLKEKFIKILEMILLQYPFYYKYYNYYFFIYNKYIYIWIWYIVLNSLFYYYIYIYFFSRILENTSKTSNKLSSIFYKINLTNSIYNELKKPDPVFVNKVC